MKFLFFFVLMTKFGLSYTSQFSEVLYFFIILANTYSKFIEKIIFCKNKHSCWVIMPKALDNCFIKPERSEGLVNQLSGFRKQLSRAEGIITQQECLFLQKMIFFYIFLTDHSMPPNHSFISEWIPLTKFHKQTIFGWTLSNIASDLSLGECFQIFPRRHNN